MRSFLKENENLKKEHSFQISECGVPIPIPR